MPTSFLSALTGSFASPAAENPTVVMIEAAYRHHGVDARYINCDVAPAALGDAVRGARAMGWAGFNCSLPHKVAVIEHLDGLADSAAVIGAVNCAVRRDGRYIGENTDGQGFLAALKTVVDPAGQSVVIFGAGGAARACAVETALAGAAEITIVNRDPDRGAELVALLNERTPAQAELVVWDGTYRVPERAGVLVNATSIGLFPDVDAELDLDPETLRPRSRRRRHHPEPAAHPARPRGGGAGRHRARRDGDARQPGRDQHPPLDRRRRRPGRDAAGGRGGAGDQRRRFPTLITPL